MRKLFILASVLAIAASCTVSEPESTSVQAPSFYAFAEGNDPATKTSISVDAEGVGTIWWKPAEKINVFFGTTSVPYTSTNTEDATTVVFETTAMIGSTEGASSNKWGLYPYDANATCNGSSVTTTIPSAQACVAGTFGTNLFPMVAQTSDNELHFFNVCGGIKFSLSRDDIESITFKGNNDEDIAGKVQISLGTDGKPACSVVSGEKTITLTPSTGVTFAKNTNYYIVMLPTVLPNGFTMTFETATQTGTFNYTEKSVEIKRSIFGTKASIDTYATFVKKLPTGVVDLGLSVCWATCNLGAASASDFGGYYQWAGINDVANTSTDLTWEKCPYHTGTNDMSGWTKYIPSEFSYYWSGNGSPDNKSVLDLQDDVAHRELGDEWRMPTKAEFDELCNSSNCTWTSEKLNGVKGVRITSRIPGYTDNSIFLPAAGYRRETELVSAGFGGYYWSSSLDTEIPAGAKVLCFEEFGGTYGMERREGKSVRPVYGERVHVSGLSLNTNSLTLSPGQSSTLTVTITPANAPEKGIIWTSSDNSVATVDYSGNVIAVGPGTATITAKAVDGDYTAMCEVTVSAPQPEAVDLGLSVKWASCNLGASNPEECGGFFQWAGTEDVKSTDVYLDNSNCPYHMSSDYSLGWTKYVPSDQFSFWSGSGDPDDKLVLDSNDDVAHVQLGGEWRMPTRDEFKELIDNCQYSSMTYKGTKGYKFTSTKDGYTDKWIFLPAMGNRVRGIFDGDGFCHYWSSSLYGLPHCAYELVANPGYPYTTNSSRYYGKNIRPVLD